MKAKSFYLIKSTALLVKLSQSHVPEMEEYKYCKINDPR